FVAFAHKRTGLASTGQVWRYPRQRPWALIAIFVIPLLTATIAGSIQLWQGYTSLPIFVLLAISITVGWIGCLWVVFCTQQNRSITKRIRRWFARQRRVWMIF